MTDYEILVSKIKESDRKVMDPIWVEEELFAIRTLKMAGNFLRMIETGKKYYNSDHSSVAYLIGLCDEAPIMPPPIIAKTARIEPPDIDTDFEDRRREEVKRYLIDKWKNVASISTVSKFSAKNIVRDISRVFAIPLSEVNNVCKKFDTLEEFLNNSNTLEFRNKYPEIPVYAKRFEGRWRSSGVHAAGMVIGNTRLNKILPLESRSIGLQTTRVPVTAYDMEGCQYIGLIKLDVLGVAALSVISDCLYLIRERQGKEIRLEELPLDDKDVLNEFALGHNVGIFQTEAQSYTALLKRMGVDSFEDLVASNALVRPGPLLTATESYISRKKGIEPIPKQHELIQDITKYTYGLFIYQEQLLQALVEIGGFSWAEADNIRKIIGKKRDKEEFRPYEEKWITNASQILGRTQARKLWGDFLKFAGYAFNKSHACAYSLLSYQTMWLKKYYGLEYMYALLKNEKELKKITTFILEARRMGIKILGPDINLSEESFMVEGDNIIRYGISQIKGVGVAATEEIINKRPFSSYQDFLSRVEKRKCTSRVMDALLRVGAFDSLEGAPDKPENSDAYLYDYLGFPKEKEEINIDLKFDIVDLENYSSGPSIIEALVKEVKVKPSYIRIEVEDSSASSVFFADPSSHSEIKEGEVILGLVHGNDLAAFIYVGEFLSRIRAGVEKTRLEKFLLGEAFEEERELYNYGIGTLEDDKSLVLPIYLRKFIVKNGPSRGKEMASVLLTDGENIEKAIIFPNAYSVLFNKIKLWSPVIVKLTTAKDGTIVIDKDNLKTIEEFKLLRGIL